MLSRVKQITDRISMSALGTNFQIRVERDNQRPTDGRIFLQVCYTAPCVHASTEQLWRGRKWYLSTHMTDDEIIKTAYAAFEAAVKHEVMEGFRVDGIILFNPHVSYLELLRVSHHQVTRADH